MSLLNRLNPRERALVLGGGALLGVLALWLYVWQPLVSQRAAQGERIARYLALIEIARDADAPPVAVAASSGDPTPLPPRITQSAEAAGIPLARLDPDGPRLRVTVASADYGALIEWILELEENADLRVLSAEMSRQTGPGQVSLQLTVEDAG